jgi:hypothetical protein
MDFFFLYEKVAKFIDLISPMYVPYKRVQHYLAFNKELVGAPDFELNERQKRIKRAQEVFNMHLGVFFLEIAMLKYFFLGQVHCQS